MIITGYTIPLMGVTAILIYVSYYFLSRKKDLKLYKLPPSPVKRWPIVGHLFQLEEDPRKQFKQWHKECGDIFSIYIGNTMMVVISGYKRMKDTLVHKGNIFSGRPPYFFNKYIGLPIEGVGFSHGPLWKEIRTTSSHILKELDVGRTTLAETVYKESVHYVDNIASFGGQATDLESITFMSFSNIICAVVFGKRFEYENPGFLKAVRCVDSLGKNGAGAAAINYFPFLQYLPGDLFKVHAVGKSSVDLITFLEHHITEIEKQRQCDDNEIIGECFVRSFQYKQQEKRDAGKDTFMNKANLIKTIFDMFAAGTHTGSLTVLWCLLYTLHHPDVQDKIHEEIDLTVGKDNSITMKDKARLPYLNAVIMETQRLASIVPFSILHMTEEDVVLDDYFIPAGTTIIPNLDSVLHDPDIWGDDASAFRPERFLNDDGSVCHREELVPFSLGKRSCLGEALGKMELFLFLGILYQRFKFLPEDQANLPSLKGHFGITSGPGPFKIRCLERQGRVI